MILPSKLLSFQFTDGLRTTKNSSKTASSVPTSVQKDKVKYEKDKDKNKKEKNASPSLKWWRNALHLTSPQNGAAYLSASTSAPAFCLAITSGFCGQV